jgi:NAD-dependent DNA ligase
MTGFRDINLQNELKEVGAKIGTSVSKNTFLVLSKNGEEEYSSKAEEAKKLGIPLLTLKEFREKYLS